MAKVPPRLTFAVKWIHGRPERKTKVNVSGFRNCKRVVPIVCTEARHFAMRSNGVAN